MQINGSLSLPLNMALIYISFQSIGYPAGLLVSITIHFHESCHFFEFFKRMHCPPSHYVFFWSSHASKSFVVSPDVQREVEKVYLYSQNNFCVSNFESVLWLPHSHHSKNLFRVLCHRCGIHHGPLR